VGDHKAAIQIMGLRHAKNGSAISKALEIIGPGVDYSRPILTKKLLVEFHQTGGK
jgi:hypothetical protein